MQHDGIMASLDAMAVPGNKTQRHRWQMPATRLMTIYALTGGDEPASERPGYIRRS